MRIQPEPAAKRRHCLVTRTVGIPFFGPEAGEVEPLGAIDTVSKLVEGALIVCLVELMRTAATRVAGGNNR